MVLDRLAAGHPIRRAHPGAARRQTSRVPWLRPRLTGGERVRITVADQGAETAGKIACRGQGRRRRQQLRNVDALRPCERQLVGREQPGHAPGQLRRGTKRPRSRRGRPHAGRSPLGRLAYTAAETPTYPLRAVSRPSSRSRPRSPLSRDRPVSRDPDAPSVAARCSRGLRRRPRRGRTMR